MSEWVSVLVLVVVAAVVCAMYYAASQKHRYRLEGFTTWPEVVDYGKSVFNPLAITTDPTRPNFIGSDDPAAIAATNRDIADATRTPQFRAGLAHDQAPGNNGTGVGLGAHEQSPYQIPVNADALAKAKLCAEVKNCSMLADPRYKDCGMCIKGGTDYTGQNPGTYAGGLYLDPSDKANYTTTNYLPSFGTCPPLNGNPMFHTDSARCVKETNRQMCRDVVGFSSPNSSHCALAQPTGTFVYQNPSDPIFSVSLRFVSPAGVRTTVEIKIDSTRGSTLAGAEATGGDGVATFNAREGQSVAIIFNQTSLQNGRRGIAAQWETSQGLVAPFESSITGIDVDGAMVSPGQRIRKFGSIGGSTYLTKGTTTVRSSASWMWGKAASNNGLIVQAFLPGLFASPTYSEDNGLQGTMPLVGKPDTASKLQLSPCDKAGQQSGQYSQDCLLDLFVSAGGDPYRGQLVSTGLSTLNQKGSKDAITNYLDEMYTTATKGKVNGRVASAQQINEASMALFGFNLASACETVVEKDDGSVGMVPIAPPLTTECLQYLWENTGTDRDRGDEDRTRKTTLQNTYTSIADRWSGLRAGESSAAKRAAHPFQTCQPKGTEYPLNPNKTINWSAMTVAEAQDGYNTIYKNANYGSGDVQAQGLAQCYGVQKAPDPHC